MTFYLAVACWWPEVRVQDVIHGEAAFLGMLLGAAMLPRDRARRWAAGGVVAFGLALAATRVGQRDSAD
ncbi:MAG: hypothetical protein ACREMX_10300, partial [Gemmatimonadales bacterium]